MYLIADYNRLGCDIICMCLKEVKTTSLSYNCFFLSLAQEKSKLLVQNHKYQKGMTDLYRSVKTVLYNIYVHPTFWLQVMKLELD